jgi:hypothetical protein
MKLSLLTFLVVPAASFVSHQRAFQRSIPVAHAQPSEQDLELTRKVILDYISEDTPAAAPSDKAEAPKKKKGKKEAEEESS